MNNEFKFEFGAKVAFTYQGKLHTGILIDYFYNHYTEDGTVNNPFLVVWNEEYNYLNNIRYSKSA